MPGTDNNDTTAASRWTRVEDYFRFGNLVVLTIVLAGLTRDRLLRLLPSTLSREYFIYFLGTTLLVIVVILLVRWSFAVGGEMRLLQEYFREYIRPQPATVLTYIALFSILLGVLGWAADNVIAFSAIFALYSVGDMWGHRLRNQQLKEAFRQGREDSDDETLTSKREAIESYYLDRPQMERSATIMFFTFVALSLALYGGTQHSVVTKDWLHVAAYIVVIANIVISEIIIWRWRKARDDVLEEIYSL